jgi:hypothetical protein
VERRMITRIRIALVAGLVCLTMAVPVADAGAKRAGGKAPTAAVSLGDSYISGEAGRWQGNSALPSPLPPPDWNGTDRAFTNSVYSDNNGCHRSDVAEIRSAELPVSEKINISCSGAQTKNIFRSSSGGQGQNGELPQANQLATVAKEKQVKLVVLSIGGNDLGFSSIVRACLQAYTASSGPCNPEQQQAIDAKFSTAMASVEKAIDEVRAAMRSANYRPADYRFVLQSYPSAIPRGAAEGEPESESEFRVPESDRNARLNIDGCPFYDADGAWARDEVVDQISNGLQSVAASKGVQFMDLSDFLQSREMCSKSTRLATPSERPSAETSDWARFLNASAVEAQGDLQETFHPNAYAQRALGNCLELLYAQTANQACENRPGGDTNAVLLKPPPTG